MTPVEVEELVDAVNRSSAAVVRMEAILTEVLASTAEQNRAIASYITQLAATQAAALKAVRRLSGLAEFGFHQCRHTFAFRWIWNGGSLSALQAVLGHASVTTTEIYARTNDALVRREAERQWAEEAREAR